VTRTQPMTLRLASASPERRAILEELGFAVDARPVGLDETPMPGEEASAMVERLARKKLMSSVWKEGWTVAADTMVEISGMVVGKPLDDDHARATLASLKKSPIRVWTATVLRFGVGEVVSDLSSATLEAKPWTEAETERYLLSGIWKGRAGSFSVFHDPCPVTLIQGRLDVVRGLNGETVCSAIGTKI